MNHSLIKHTSQLKPYAKAKQAVTAQHDIRHSLQTILTAHQHSFKALNADAMAQDCRQNKARGVRDSGENHFFQNITLATR